MGAVLCNSKHFCILIAFLFSIYLIHRDTWSCLRQACNEFKSDTVLGTKVIRCLCFSFFSSHLHVLFQTHWDSCGCREGCSPLLPPLAAVFLSLPHHGSPFPGFATVSWQRWRPVSPRRLQIIRVLSGDKCRHGSPEVLIRSVCTAIFIAAAAATGAVYHSGNKEEII